MKITVTTTSQTLAQLLSAEDYGIFRSYYFQSTGGNMGGGGGGICRNEGPNKIYIETGKAATTTDSFYINSGDILTIGFLHDAIATQFRTDVGEAELLILF